MEVISAIFQISAGVLLLVTANFSMKAEGHLSALFAGIGLYCIGRGLDTGSRYRKAVSLESD